MALFLFLLLLFVYRCFQKETSLAFLSWFQVSLSLARAVPRLRSTVDGPGVGEAARAAAQDEAVTAALTEAFLAADADFIANQGQVR
jgi:hypothetical protein